MKKYDNRTIKPISSMQMQRVEASLSVESSARRTLTQPNLFVEELFLLAPERSDFAIEMTNLCARLVGCDLNIRNMKFKKSSLWCWHVVEDSAPSNACTSLPSCTTSWSGVVSPPLLPLLPRLPRLLPRLLLRLPFPFPLPLRRRVNLDDEEEDEDEGGKKI